MRLRSLFLAPLLALTACGYHTVGSAAHLPANVRTLAVPVFTTRTQAFHTEFVFTQAVIRELNTRTKYQILPRDAEADATLRGVILSQSSSPLTYDSSSGQTSSYLITITASVTLTARDGHVLYRNDALPFREQYQSTQDLSAFHPGGLPRRSADIPRLRRGHRLRHPGVLLVSAPIKGFANADRFLAELSSPDLRPGYVLIGDEAFLYQRCRAGVLAALAPPDQRDFCLHDLDLADTSIFEILDHAQTPSLMAPFQVFFVRNLKTLYGRGSKKEEFAAIDAYFRRPNPQALLLFVADHLSIPTDLRRMDYQDKERFERIRDTLGEWCGLVELARVDEADAVRWLIQEAAPRGVTIDQDAARELVDALGADMMLVASDFEKLCLYAQGKQLLTLASQSATTPNITLGDVETMVLAAKQRSLYELTDAISRRDRPQALASAARPAQRLRRRRRLRHWPSLHARPHLPPDADHRRERRTRRPRHLVRPLAGLSHAALRRRRPHPPGAPLSSRAPSSPAR